MNFISTPAKEKTYGDDPFLMDESEEGEKEIPDEPKSDDDEEDDDSGNY